MSNQQIIADIASLIRRHNIHGIEKIVPRLKSIIGQLNQYDLVVVSLEMFTQCIDYHCFDTARLLLEAGCTLRTIGNYAGPFWYAVDSCSSEFVELFIEYGANVEETDASERNLSMLALAAENGSDDIVGLLIGAGANIDRCDNNGKSCLEYIIDAQMTHLVGAMEIVN